jgi:LPS-assembly protein
VRRVPRVAALALALAALGLLRPAAPQEGPPASLIADQVTYDRESGLLVATGNIEVLYEGRVLRARRIVYDEAADEIRAEGPLVLTDPAGGVLLAAAAALTPDLEDGLITSARLLIEGRMQLAAVEMRRTGGRYDTLYRTVASSCTVCAENPTPTWAIRATRITRDEAERRLYFENARFELFGLPIGYVPRASIPEPGVERASGLLTPSFHSSSDIFGVGFKLPYYRVLGPSADVTVTPFLTSKGTKILEGEYRQRLTNGGFDLSGVFALDDGLPDEGYPDLRGALAADGSYGFGAGFVADFDLQVASDDDFLQQFDYSDADRLTSTASIHRTVLDEYVSLGTVAFQSLRDDEETDTIPYVFPEFTYRRLIETPGVGGRLGIDGESLGVLRDVGGNMVRLGGGLDWRQDWVLPRGILAETTAAAVLDVYRAWDYTGEPEGVLTRGMPTAAVKLRWPWVRPGARADHVIEPIAQVIWSETWGEQDVPNEDSQLPEFDTSNLFSLNRFPGEDRLETGLRANLGVSYTRQAPSGWSLGVTFGQVIRAEPDDDFDAGTGLSGRYSDYVGALSIDFARLSLVNRVLFDTDFEFNRNEFAMAWDAERAGLRAAYVYLAEDDSNPFVGPQPETNEVALEARYRVHPNWEVRGLWRYDLASDSNLRAGAGVTYGNECAEFDLSVSRRYTSSDNVPPSTSIGFNLRLAGIGEDGEREWPARVCMARGT